MSSTGGKAIEKSIGLPSGYPTGGRCDNSTERSIESACRCPFEEHSIDCDLPFTLYDGTGVEMVPLCNPIQEKGNTTSTQLVTTNPSGEPVPKCDKEAFHRRGRNRALSDDDFEDLIKEYSSALVL
eukprot:scaffold5064_cov121-Cylindrotheca_fusiformis.AAC.7